MNTLKEKILDKMDAEIMDWIYEVVKVNFGADMIQDSTELRKIIEENLDDFFSQYQTEQVKAIKTALKGIDQEIVITMFVLKFQMELFFVEDVTLSTILRAIRQFIRP